MIDSKKLQQLIVEEMKKFLREHEEEILKRAEKRLKEEHEDEAKLPKLD